MKNPVKIILKYEDETDTIIDDPKKINRFIGDLFIGAIHRDDGIKITRLSEEEKLKKFKG